MKQELSLYICGQLLPVPSASITLSNLQREGTMEISCQRPAHMLALLRLSHFIPFANVDAKELSGAHPAEIQSFVQVKWIGSSNHYTHLDPLSGEPLIKFAEVDEAVTQLYMLQIATRKLQEKSLSHGKLLRWSVD